MRVHFLLIGQHDIMNFSFVQLRLLICFHQIFPLQNLSVPRLPVLFMLNFQILHLNINLLITMVRKEYLITAVTILTIFQSLISQILIAQLYRPLTFIVNPATWTSALFPILKHLGLRALIHCLQLKLFQFSLIALLLITHGVSFVSIRVSFYFEARLGL